jgi:hypothetical protein
MADDLDASGAPSTDLGAAGQRVLPVAAACDYAASRRRSAASGVR